MRIGEALEAALDIPVYVDNDTRTLTIAEQHFGMSHSRQNFVLVTVGRGVGMGAVVNGELVRGHHDIGAEFGHITMALDGPLCLCGKCGCLEAIASDVGIIQAASAADLVTPAQATIVGITARARAGLVLDDLLSPALYDRRPVATIRSAALVKATKSRR